MKILNIVGSGVLTLARIAFVGLLMVGTFVMNCVGLIICAVTE